MPRIQSLVTPPVRSVLPKTSHENQERRLASTVAMIEPSKVRPSDPASRLIEAALASAISRLQANDPAARRGEVEGIHRLRTTTRRLRGELRAFQHLLDPDWYESIKRELKWLAAALGRVTAKTFVMPIDRDQFFPPADCRAEQELTPGAELRVIPSIMGHMGLFGFEQELLDAVDANLKELLAAEV